MDVVTWRPYFSEGFCMLESSINVTNFALLCAMARNYVPNFCKYPYCSKKEWINRRCTQINADEEHVILALPCEIRTPGQHAAPAARGLN